MKQKDAPLNLQMQMMIPLLISLISYNSKSMLRVFLFFFCYVAAGILQLRSIFECSAISGDAFWRIEELELFIPRLLLMPLFQCRVVYNL